MDIQSEIPFSPVQNLQSKLLKLKTQPNSENIMAPAIANQKFESPTSAKCLTNHRFKCSCKPSSEPYACSSAYKWLEIANQGRKFEIQKHHKSYLDLLGIKNFISMAEER